MRIFDLSNAPLHKLSNIDSVTFCGKLGNVLVGKLCRTGDKEINVKDLFYVEQSNFLSFPASWYLLLRVVNCRSKQSHFYGQSWGGKWTGGIHPVLNISFLFWILNFSGASGSSPSNVRRLLIKFARFISTRLIIRW